MHSEGYSLSRISRKNRESYHFLRCRFYNHAVATQCNLGQLLRKCKILAARLDSKPLEKWLIWESNGYPEEIELPKYRVWHLLLKGYFSGPLNSGYQNLSIPENVIPEKLRKIATSYRCRHSVTVIEDMLKNGKSNTFSSDCSNLASILGSDVLQGHTCLNVHGEFGRNHFVEVLNTVQNKVLDFVLALEKEYPNAGEIVFDSGLDPKIIHQIFNTTIIGGETTLVGIVNDSLIISGVKANNFDTLKRYLKKQGLTTEDIEDLKQALKGDGDTKESSKLGDSVANWISKMVNKAATGAWNIGVGAATNILANALQKFYGF